MTIDNFADFHLPSPVLDAITEMGFYTPTPIQAQAIEPLAHGRDVVGVAQTGTGKTAAFGLPLLARIDPEAAGVQALVLAPTRELAIQNAAALASFSSRMPTLRIATVYGGASYKPQIDALRSGASIVVGTPGRIMDLMDKGELSLGGVSFFVLDEADEMLRMGFQDDVEKISADIPSSAVCALFSATMPPAIEGVANRYLTDPLRIAVTPQASTVDNIDQTYAVVPFKFKTDALVRVLSVTNAQACIVFVARRVDAETVGHELSTAGFKTASISGDVNQKERERIVGRLREGSIDVLVATDIAARGLDVDRIELVVNYDVPKEAEAYVHRIGRTGRAGRAGTSISFFTPREQYLLRQIEKLTGTRMQEVAIPAPDDVVVKVAKRVVAKAYSLVGSAPMDLYRQVVDDQVSEGVDPAALAQALLAFACNDTGRASFKRGDGRIRREETVDEDGRFLSAVFEHGRSKPRPSRSSHARSSHARTSAPKTHRGKGARAKDGHVWSSAGSSTRRDGRKGEGAWGRTSYDGRDGKGRRPRSKRAFGKTRRRHSR